MKKYLVRFIQVREDFRLEELRAICLAEEVIFPEDDIHTYSTFVSSQVNPSLLFA